MKKLCLVLLCAVLFLPFSGHAAHAETLWGEFTYILLPDGTAELTGWSGDDAALILPESVDGHVVTSIGSRAFCGERYSRRQYSTVSIPPTVKKIGDFAFAYSSLTAIELPLSITEVGANPFLMCIDLDFIISSGHPRLEVVDGALYDKMQRRLISYSPHSGDSLREAYQIAPGTLIVGDYAMYAPGNNDYQGYSFRQILIPDGVTTIGDLALHGHSFMGMEPDGTPMNPLVIPDSVVHLGQNPFLKSVYSPDLEHPAFNLVIPENHPTLRLIDGVLYDISEKRLIGCYLPMLRKSIPFTVPDWVRHIDAYAFMSQTLNPIVLPDKLLTIGEGAFYNCYVREIVLPRKITELPRWAFYSSRIQKITLPARLSTIGEGAFESSSLVSIVIPSGVTMLPDRVFAYCSSLKSVMLPPGLIDIGEKAFIDCKALTDIQLSPGILSIGNHAFFFCSSLTSLYLPSSLTSIGEMALCIDANYSSDGIFVYDTCTLYAQPGSWAESYCIDQGYKVLAPSPSKK